MCKCYERRQVCRDHTQCSESVVRGETPAVTLTAAGVFVYGGADDVRYRCGASGPCIWRASCLLEMIEQFGSHVITQDGSGNSFYISRKKIAAVVEDDLTGTFNIMRYGCDLLRHCAVNYGHYALASICTGAVIGCLSDYFNNW